MNGIISYVKRIGVWLCLLGSLYILFIRLFVLFFNVFNLSVQNRKRHTGHIEYILLAHTPFYNDESIAQAH